jgi:hypothetical protein
MSSGKGLRPGQSLPQSTDLLATHQTNRRWRLCFTIGPPQPHGPSGRPVPIWVAGRRDTDADVKAVLAAGPAAFRPVRALVPGLAMFETDLPAPPVLARLSRPGRHRAQCWQTARGAPRWSAIVVSARGYPDLRVLQVALHERWLAEDDAARAMTGALQRTHFWGGSSGGQALTAPQREFLDAVLIAAAALALTEQARNGRHTPTYPLWRPYLRLLVKKELVELWALGKGPGGDQESAGSESDSDEAADVVSRAEQTMADAQLHGGPTTDAFIKPPEPEIPDSSIRRTAAALAGGWHEFNRLPGEERRTHEHYALGKLEERSRWNPRTLRDAARQLARADGHESLSVLSSQEREVYEDWAVRELQRRRDLRELRQAMLSALDSGGVMISRRAVEQFVARHADDSAEQRRAAVRAYLAQRGIRLIAAVGRR